MRIEKLRATWDVDIRFIHFPLHTETPPDGLTLEQLFAGRNIDIKGSQERIAQLMADEGLPFGPRTMTYNSRLAQELASFAVTQPGGERIHTELFQAYFVDNINLARVENLMEIASRIGLDPQECSDILSSGRFAESVDSDWNRARSIGLTGVPAFLVGQNGVSGAQPIEVLHQLLETAGARRRNSASADA